MIELLLVCLIGDEIRLNDSLEESSREFIYTSDLQLRLGTYKCLMRSSNFEPGIVLPSIIISF